MSGARYIGRVGGLAVALGVGSAIALGGGVAYADAGTAGAGASHDTSSTGSANSPGKAERVKKPNAPKAPKVADSKASDAGSKSLPDKDSDSTAGDTGGRRRSTPDRPASMVKAGAPKPTAEVSAPTPTADVSAPAAPVSAAVTPQIQATTTAVKPPAGSVPTAPVQSPGAWVLLAAARRELGVERTVSVLPVSAVNPSASVGPTATSLLSLNPAGPVVQFDDGIIHGSIGTPLSGPVTYTVLGGSQGKVRMLGTGAFTYLPNYTDVTTGTAEQFKVRVTQQTAFVQALEQIPLLGSVVPNLLVTVRQIPVLGGLLAPIIGSSVVVPVNVDLAGLVPSGAPVAYTYMMASFDGTPISVNFFPASGLQAGHVAPTVMYGPGMTQPAVVDPYSQGFVGVGTMRSAGYNVVTWDPRGEYYSGGTLQLDNPNFEGKDVSSIISWMAKQPGVQLDNAATLDPRMGMIGVSYGGGIQFATAINDKRIDAIVPGLAWNSLNDALYPSGAFKTAWGSLLALGLVQTGARINPQIYSGIVLGDLLGILTKSQQDVLASSGPGDLVKNITAPTLILQGTVDDLMTLNQAMKNVALMQGNVDANGNPLPLKMIWFCGGHGVCLDPQSAIANQLLTDETLNWLDRYVKGDTSVNTGPKFEWVDQNGQFYASDVMPTAPSFHGTPITDTGGGGLMPLIPIFGGSGPLGNPLGLDQSLPMPTKAQNAINIPLALPTTGTTQLVGSPQVTVNYTGVGTGRFVYGQIVDNNTGRVVGNVVTPIPVKLDGQAHQVTVNLESIAYTAKPGDSLTLQLVASTTPYESFTSFGFINVSSVAVSLPTVAAGVVAVGSAPPVAA
ncbi:peptidase S15 [Mycobacterium sp. CBMA293]|uniref:CocE/NonD family hydrolase n=3 Tax=Mycolicibacterium TaxID=1866885 RepID=UPI0012DD5D94|nr:MULTISPECIES: CocE/NonD family hydrolase [unclassified Mycolicibacterium]MUL71766.1 peptidase S15 [Mycolicibacterium sp. CBMA 311]MUM13081.1 peptidase S15 [Mycolicibacterium sp. CBMA 293]MUL49213.1 peptidase S15 [Mycolicibacterium sp. CBMA 360]MUL60753.1 peptidase S15 [Mycolicibacterium sp. CBMA 335]MUL95694.1 peptidase S15 [Mycolicibacterium sp. CBMA 230]